MLVNRCKKITQNIYHLKQFNENIESIKDNLCPILTRKQGYLYKDYSITKFSHFTFISFKYIYQFGSFDNIQLDQQNKKLFNQDRKKQNQQKAQSEENDFFVVDEMSQNNLPKKQFKKFQKNQSIKQNNSHPRSQPQKKQKLFGQRQSRYENKPFRRQNIEQKSQKFERKSQTKTKFNNDYQQVKSSQKQEHINIIGQNKNSSLPKFSPKWIKQKMNEQNEYKKSKMNKIYKEQEKSIENLTILQRDTSKQLNNDLKKIERSCHYIIRQFKDQCKQSKTVNDSINIFYLYKRKLLANGVLKTVYQSKFILILYASTFRSLNRIIRREEQHIEYLKISEFLGENYQKITIKNQLLSDLYALEIGDFLGFFFQVCISQKFLIFNQQKLEVVNVFLEDAYKRLEKKGKISWGKDQMSTNQTNTNESRMMSFLIMSARCAQVHSSPMYQKFLLFLEQEMQQMQLFPYVAVSISRFLLRGENYSSVNIEVKIFKKLMEIVQTKKIYEKMDSQTFAEFYINLSSILRNFSYLKQFSQEIKIMDNINDNILQNLHLFETEFFDKVINNLIRNGDINNKVFQAILSNIFNKISSNGQTTLNPIFILNMVSQLQENCKNVLQKIKPSWEKLFVKMYTFYFVGSQIQPNLHFCNIFINRIHKSDLLSDWAKKQIFNSFYFQKYQSILPYDKESFLLENFYLESKNVNLIYASILRMKNMTHHNITSQKQFQQILQLLDSKIPSNLRKQVISKNEKYINESSNIKLNRQGFIKTLAKYFNYFKQDDSINMLFKKQLISALKTNEEVQERQKTLRNSRLDELKKQGAFLTFQDQISAQFLIQNLDNNLSRLKEKTKSKILSVISTYFFTLFEVKKIKFILQSNNMPLNFFKTNEFLATIQKSRYLTELYMQFLTSKDMSMTLNFTNNINSIIYIINSIKYLLERNAQNQNQSSRGLTSQSASIKQKYYFIYYEMLKRYNQNALKKILTIQESRSAIQKILLQSNPKAKDVQKIITFKYDAVNNFVEVPIEEAKILRKKIIKCIEDLQQFNN